MRQILLLAISIFLLTEVRSQYSDDLWSPYKVYPAIDTAAFNRLSGHELAISKKIDNFKSERARLTLSDGANQIKPLELQSPDFPTLCICFAQNDTIHISSGVGFFANLGVSVLVNKDDFSTTFFQSADGANIFKLQQEDTSYDDRISVPAVQQQLRLLKKPSLFKDEIIIGNLEAKFKSFYETESGSTLIRNYNVKLFFRCSLRVIPATRN